MTLAATLTPEQAAARRWPAVVVGAGPAGAVAAAELARRGVRVLLVDRSAFPRAKACGCCLNGRALAALAEAGLGDVLARLGAVPLTTFRLCIGGKSVTLPLPGGVAVSREAFDAALVEAAVGRGAEFLPQARAAMRVGARSVSEGVFPLAHASGSERRLTLLHAAGQFEVRADVVLAADGLGGALLSRGGIPCPGVPGARIGAAAITDTGEPFYRLNTIYMTCGPAGYTGLVRLEDGRLDVACAVQPAAVRDAGGPGEVVCDLLRRAGWPVPAGLRDGPWRGTPALTRQARHVAGDRLFALGDATGYVEPFTGEGMAWAISSAVAVAELAARPWRPELAVAWARRHRLLVTRRQWACRAAAFVLRRPALAATLVALLSRLPAAAGPMIRYLNQRPPPLAEIR
jgi:flavin-dependent dehydrogenase